MNKGILISLEGGDGAGKTVQVKVLVDYFKSQGYKVATFREPGGTSLGEEIRRLLLTSHMERETELMLFTAARIENIVKNIIPHLDEGYIVIMDRFVDSTYAYQGHGRGLLVEVAMLENVIINMVEIDHVFCLDADLETMMKRLSDRTGQSPDRLDSEGVSFKQRVIDGFRKRVADRPDTRTMIDANRTVEEVSKDLITQINTLIMPLLNEHNKVIP